MLLGTINHFPMTFSTVLVKTTKMPHLPDLKWPADSLFSLFVYHGAINRNIWHLNHMPYIWYHVRGCTWVDRRTHTVHPLACRIIIPDTWTGKHFRHSNRCRSHSFPPGIASTTIRGQSAFAKKNAEIWTLFLLQKLRHGMLRHRKTSPYQYRGVDEILKRETANCCTEFVAL